MSSKTISILVVGAICGFIVWLDLPRRIDEFNSRKGKR